MVAIKQVLQTILQKVSDFLKALWIFLPGIVFLVLGLILFTSLSQGKDVIYQSADPIADVHPSWHAAFYLVMATIFWVFTTWYTSRLIAYNHEEQNQKTPWMLNHFPRLLGYCIFLVLGLAIYSIDDYEGKKRVECWAIALSDIALYVVAYYFIAGRLKKYLNKGSRNLEARRKRVQLMRNIVRMLVLSSCVLVVLFWRENQVKIFLPVMLVFQLGFLFLVVVRHPLYQSAKNYTEPPKRPRDQQSGSLLKQYMRLALWKSEKHIDLEFEKPIFIFYHVLALIAVVSYIISINSIDFARELKTFPVVLLAFGILVGIINLIALFSRIFSVNFNFFILLIIVIAGYLYDPHNVRLLDASTNDGTTTSQGKIYSQRPDFRAYVGQWIRLHQQELDTTKTVVPMFFILADGGASRSGYWAASVLGRMHEETKYAGSTHSFFTDHLFCLSGASGGAVGNTVFLSAYALQQKNPALSTTWLSQKFLGSDFLVYPLARMLGPELLEPVFGGLWMDRAYALENGMDHPVDSVKMMGALVRNSFSQLLPTASNGFPVLAINTTRVNDGSPGVVCTIDMDSIFFGKRIDVLEHLPKTKDIRISTAMILGARFPYMSPGGKLGDSYFVDGGYFDNSGAGVVHEMLLGLKQIVSDSNSLLHKYKDRIHPYVIHLANSPYSSSSVNKTIHPLKNDLAAPLLTLAGSYDSQTSVNDTRLVNYLKQLKDSTGNSYIIFNLYSENRKDEHYPMNWVISKRQRDSMKIRIQKPEIDSVIARMHERRGLDKLFDQLGVKN